MYGFYWHYHNTFTVHCKAKAHTHLKKYLIAGIFNVALVLI